MTWVPPKMVMSCDVVSTASISLFAPYPYFWKHGARQNNTMIRPIPMPRMFATAVWKAAARVRPYS